MQQESKEKRYFHLVALSQGLVALSSLYCSALVFRCIQQGVCEMPVWVLGLKGR